MTTSKRWGGWRMAVALVIAGASVGVSMFGVLAWRAVTIRPADDSEAGKRFEAVRSSLLRTIPLVQRDSSGHFVRRERIADQGNAPKVLRVLAYRASEERLVGADVPLWFFRVKGPAVQLALRRTTFDLESLGLTAADLERASAGLVLDESRDNGDRVLAWTE
jgi:hypothetical protein